MASLVEMQSFQGNAGLALPAGVATVVATVPLPTARKISPQIQAVVHVGVKGGAVATQIEVVASIVGSAGAVVAVAGAFVDVGAGGNVSINWVCSSAVLPPDGYSVVVTASPVSVPGAVADMTVQSQSGQQDAVFVSAQVFG